MELFSEAVDFSAFGYSLCIVDTQGSHADLTDEYAAIPQEMRRVARFFGQEYLRDVYAASHKEVKRNLAGTGVLNHAGSDSFRDSLPIFKGMRICPT